MSTPLSSCDAPKVLSQGMDTQLDTISRLSRRGAAEKERGATESAVWLAQDLIGSLFNGTESAEDALCAFLLVFKALGWIEWQESGHGKILHGAELRHKKRLLRQAEQTHGEN